MSKFTLTLAIERAIKAESLSLKFFTELSAKFYKHPDIKEVLDGIALQEAEHKRVFEQLLAKVPLKKDSSRPDDIDFLNTIDISAYFDALDHIDTMQRPSEIINLAFEFEKDTVLFYIALRDLYGMDPALDEIIRNEKSHMTILMKYLLTDFRLKGLEDVWD
jgi:rubrerythrin